MGVNDNYARLDSLVKYLLSTLPVSRGQKKISPSSGRLLVDTKIIHHMLTG